MVCLKMDYWHFDNRRGDIGLPDKMWIITELQGKQNGFLSGSG